MRTTPTLARSPGRDDLRDPDDFDAFVRASGDRMLRSAVLLCGDRARAEDLVQSAYATAFARWRLVCRADHPVAYVRTILVRTYLDEQRRKRVPELPLTADAPARSDRADLRLSLLDALRTLGPIDRAVVVLRFWEDLSVADAAHQLGLSENALRTRSSRALAALRARFPELAEPDTDEDPR